MSRLTKILFGIAVPVALALGSCQSSSSSSGGSSGGSAISGCTDSSANNYDSSATQDDGSCTYDSAKTIPQIGEISLPSSVNEKTPFTWTVNASNEDGNPIYLYKTNNAAWLTLNTTPGVENSVTSPEVDKDTTISETVYACNEDLGASSKFASIQKGDSKLTFKNLNNSVAYDSDKCSSANVSTTVINVEDPVDPEVPALGGITNTQIIGQTNSIVDFDINSPNEGEEGVLYDLKFGDDSSGDFSGLSYDSITGIGSFNAVGFEDKSGSLEASVMRGDELENKTIPINLSYDNPITATLTKTFGEDGNVTWDYNAQTPVDESKLDNIDVDLNGSDYSTTNDINQNTIGFNLNTPIINGENSMDIMVDTYANDTKTTSGSFVPATEAEARAKIDAALASKGLTEDVDYVKDSSYGFFATKDCAYANIGDYLNVAVDYKTSTGKTINYTSFDDTLSTDLENYDKLNTCKNSGDSLQLSRFPSDEVESRTNNFLN